MKKLKLLTFCMLFVFIASAQKGPYAGGQFAYNTTWLMNKFVFDAGDDMDHVVSYGNYFGIIAGYNFNDELGLEINLNRNTINQKYEGEINNNAYTSNIKINATDVPLLFKYGEKSFFELGLALQFLNAVSYDRTFDNPIPIFAQNYKNEDVLSKFNKTNFGVIFGFGGSVPLIEYKLKLDIGFRIQYTFTDMEGIDARNRTKEQIAVIYPSKKDNFFNNALIGGFRLGLKYYFFD